MRGPLRSPTIPPGLSMHECGTAGSALPAPFVPQSTSLWVRPRCHESRLSRLPVSTPHTGLEECFFFISLVVGLRCVSIFCQFWLFFVFKLLLSLFCLCEEAQCVCLHLHLEFSQQAILVINNGWTSGQTSYFLFLPLFFVPTSNKSQC